MTHTPGPWTYEQRCSGIVITPAADTEKIIATIVPADMTGGQQDQDEITDEQEANAALMAKAPELHQINQQLQEINGKLRQEIDGMRRMLMSIRDTYKTHLGEQNSASQLIDNLLNRK